jgi:hypothetical protein
MKLKLALATATALMGMTISSFAVDGNQLYLDQSGDSNAVSSSQSGSYNTVGAETGLTRARQAGDHNKLEISQSGDHNVGSAKDGGTPRGIDQLGSYGYMRLDQPGDYNLTAGMTQFGGSNDMRIYQQSNSNVVGSATQDTRGTVTTSPANALQIIQRGGNGNIINAASQSGTGNAMYLTQDGIQNRVVLASQGVFHDTQTTNGYMAISQSGNYNLVNSADQDGDRNSMTLNVNGSSNGTTAFGSSIASGVSATSGVAQGSLHQAGIGNSLNVALNAGNTSFSFSQTGNYDTLSGSVNFGVGNELATNQHDGTGNSIGFQVGGNDNVIGFDQTGSSNSISSAQAGNGNVASLNQSGTGNASTISQQ